MTPHDIRRVFASYITSNWTETAISWPNIQYNVKPDVEFIRITFGWGDCVTGELSESGIDIETSTLFIDIFTKKDSGTSRPLGYADDLRKLFRRKKLFNEDNSAYIYCDTVNIREINNLDDLFYHVKCSVVFHNFVC